MVCKTKVLSHFTGSSTWRQTMTTVKLELDKWGEK